MCGGTCYQGWASQGNLILQSKWVERQCGFSPIEPAITGFLVILMGEHNRKSRHNPLEHTPWDHLLPFGHPALQVSFDPRLIRLHSVVGFRFKVVDDKQDLRMGGQRPAWWCDNGRSAVHVHAAYMRCDWFTCSLHISYIAGGVEWSIVLSGESPLHI